MNRILRIAMLAGTAIVLAGGIAVATDAAARGGSPGGYGAGGCWQTAQAQPGMGQGRGMGPGAGAGAGPGRMFTMLDADGNGAVSLPEFLAGPQGRSGVDPQLMAQHRTQRFQQLDRNGDGSLTPDELGPGVQLQ
ncbi:hypothetical protein [Azospirillum sp. ST 5-10]|uniref:hypothetical protein n=1 Tax=unclassified Azospirillum TaxID=2630922 RepID=UPI003F49DE14